MTLYEKILKLCKYYNVSKNSLEKACGFSQNLINKWKDSSPSIDKLVAVSKYFNISFEELLRDTDFSVSAERIDEPLIFFPEIATIKAGFDGIPQEITSGETVPIPSSYITGSQSDYMIFRVTGNSMAPRILDGDQVLVRRQDSVDSGTLAVVLYNGEEATIKKVEYKQGEDWLRLIPYNYEYEAKTISGADLEQCRVIGKVIKLIRSL